MRNDEKLENSFKKLLKEKFPILYGNIDVHWRDGGLGGLGFVGAGWFGILYELGEKLEPELEKMPKENRARLVQIKEKFAGLAFYLRGKSTDKIRKIVSEASKKSRKTCERCGKRGRLSNLGWLLTLCDECHDQRIKERKRGGLWTINN